jgi:N-acetylneuraminic acid mutarotase
MGKIYLCLFLLIFNNVSSQGIWTSIATLPSNTAWSECASFCIGNYGYVCTGFSGVASQDNWRYDPAANQWTQMASFPGTARWEAVGFSIKNFGFITGGFDWSSNNPNDLWQYDPFNNTWLQKANFPGQNGKNATAFVINDKAFVVTGQGGPFTNHNWEYDFPSDTWTQKNNFPGYIRVGAVSFAVNDLGYVGLGYAKQAGDQIDLWQYNPSADAWTQMANFPGMWRHDAVAFSICNYGYAGTGYGNSSFWKDFYRYNTLTNSWTQITSMPGFGRSEATAFVINNRAYVGGGNQSSYTTSFYKYDWQDTCYPLNVGIEEIDLPASSIFASQNNGMMYITAAEMINSIEVYSMSGKLLQKYLPGQNNFSFSLNGLATGIYFMRLNTRKKVLIEKFLKE